MKNNLQYYNLHEMGYTFNDGSMQNLTALQSRYLMYAEHLKQEHINNEIEEIKNKSGKKLGNKKLKTKSKLRDKIKQKRGGGK